MWILVLILVGGYNQSRVHSIEFSSFDTCKKAAEGLKAAAPRIVDYTICVQK